MKREKDNGRGHHATTKAREVRSRGKLMQTEVGHFADLVRNALRIDHGHYARSSQPQKVSDGVFITYLLAYIPEHGRTPQVSIVNSGTEFLFEEAEQSLTRREYRPGETISPFPAILSPEKMKDLIQFLQNPNANLHLLDVITGPSLQEQLRGGERSLPTPTPPTLI